MSPNTCDPCPQSIQKPAGPPCLEVTASDKLLDNLIEMAKELHDGAK